METKTPEIGLNSSPKTLLQPVILQGKKVDPFSGGILNTDAFCIVKPSDIPGISFRVGSTIIPYDSVHLQAIDSTLGRMLRVTDNAQTFQIVLVEHLLSAIQLLWLTNIEIVLDESDSGPLTSSAVPIFWLKKKTYWIPVMGPGVSGFVGALAGHSRPLSEVPEIIKIHTKAVYSIIDPNPKYKWIERMMSIEPADRLIVQILSAQQPDINNNPDASPITIEEGEDVSDFLRARPVMRLANKFQESVLFFMNLRSFALTRETYFRSKPSLTREQVVRRMFPEFQEGQNEHLYHTALADFPSELWAFLRGRHLHARIQIKDGNHSFRMQALAHLLFDYISAE
jgi:hypothetical protein